MMNIVFWGGVKGVYKDQVRLISMWLTSNDIISYCWEYSKSSLLAIFKHTINYFNLLLLYCAIETSTKYACF